MRRRLSPGLPLSVKSYLFYSIIKHKVKITILLAKEFKYKLYIPYFP
ncbi:hypothetical protein CHY_0878 [Carboxydothermus hydrogenoformans Z-2901]|uniref:Uncharacterized protein n=1 Tax=Carboxydothermus hydrogenoformans (strain ATCC BAA-161 / DSM 6008 / Z-2901) TaxID=246194 RepID=Q3ADQ6_CARHZ|nr:hypothetical protein CHY_0878 [Carboxydothermus hydrogenoformans Z-2901]